MAQVKLRQVGDVGQIVESDDLNKKSNTELLSILAKFRHLGVSKEDLASYEEMLN